MVTVLTLMLPWMPFLLDENLPVNKSRMDVLQQIFRRLFPFQRGLLHDYWAANIWALYAFADKLAAVGISKLAVPLVQGNMALNSMPVLHGVLEWLQQRMQSNDGHQFALLPEPSPLVCGALLFLSIIPGMQVVSSRFMINNGKLIQGVVYTSFSAFMLSYHVHEKAILTALLPLAVLVRPTNKSHRSSLTQHLYWNLLFIYVNVWGLLGLFPLLFRPVELLLKITTYILYLALANILLQLPDEVTNSWMTYILVGSVFLLLECMPVVGKWEFLPLMSTSVVCALGLVGCWGVSLWLLVRREEADKQYF
jgi:alpha-1,3-glucosyltransferase